MPVTDVNTDGFRLSPEQAVKIPSTLNILTILTFIGSGLGLLYVAFLPALTRFMLGVLEKASNSDQELSATQLAEMERGKSALEMTQANIVPLMLTGFVGLALCIWGAILMRKLKKDGYWIYVAGEILPVIVSLILLGTAQFNGVFSVIFAIGIPVVFVILYTMQRKYLVH
jgi:hypothetical protein